jgi:hypothetical protein
VGSTLGVRVAPAFGLVAVGLLWAASAAAQDAAQPSAQEIVSRVAKAYAECASYRDTGVVRIVYLEAGGERTEERPFSTAFVRPDRLRFEFRETSIIGTTKRYIVWRRGEVVRTWWDVRPGVEVASSLDSALGAATGVSGGSAHAIPALLLPQEIGGRRLTGMADVKRAADAQVGGVSCYCVEGHYGNVPRKVCVDKRSFMVRSVDFEETFPEFRTHETTTYAPVIDEPVARELLEFRAPAKN